MPPRNSTQREISVEIPACCPAFRKKHEGMGLVAYSSPVLGLVG